jgi:hypothetical protein
VVPAFYSLVDFLHAAGNGFEADETPDTDSRKT